MWFPEGTRGLETLRFDEGRASGLELLVRRHGEGVTGWLAYGLATVSLTDAESGRDYNPPWDRRHSVDIAAFIPLPWGLEASARVTYGTGTAFWPFGGYQVVARHSTFTGNLYWTVNNLLPFWSSEQARMPQYFRVDLGMHGEFRAFGARFEPSVGVINATARPNVLYYRPQRAWLQQDSEGPRPLIPQTLSDTNLVPSFGLHVYF